MMASIWRDFRNFARLRRLVNASKSSPRKIGIQSVRLLGEVKYGRNGELGFCNRLFLEF